MALKALLKLTILMYLINTEVDCQSLIKVLEAKEQENCSKQGFEMETKPIESQEVNEFTICVRFMIKYQKMMSIFQIGRLWSMLYDFEEKFGFIPIDDKSLPFFWEKDMRLQGWNSICFAFSKQHYLVVLNGDLLIDDVFNFPLFPMKDFANSTVYLGCDSLYFHKFHGLISDFNIWSYALKTQTLLKITTTCLNFEIQSRPDLLQWGQNESQFVSNQCFDINDVDCKHFFTKDNRTEIIQIEEPVAPEEALMNCRAYGGELHTPRNEEEFANIIKIKCPAVHVGMKTEKNLILTSLGEVVDFITWMPSRPNGKHIEQCIFIDTKYKKYNDGHCVNGQFCYTCEIPVLQSFEMRGSVPGNLDTIYFTNTANLPLKIHGQAGISNMEWKNGSWCIEELCAKAGNERMPPFGIQTWNDSHLLLGQNRDDQFICHKYGNLIPMSKRCDGLNDCLHDRSDEENCTIIIFNESPYESSMNPKEQRENMKTNVVIKLFLEDIFDIEEISLSFKVRIKVKMSWVEPRLTFRNLKNDTNKNIIPRFLINQLWYPQLAFGNSKEGQRTIVDSETSFHVERSGNHTLNPRSELYKDYLYSGSDNPIIMQRFYTVALRCPFELSSYPFDQQSCPIVLKVPFDHLPYIQINATGKPQFDETITFLQYKFLGLGEYQNIDGKIITIKAKLQRIYSSHVITTFLPTIGLITITQLIMFIDPAHFEATIMVALTSMLVMYTLYQSVSETLPTTSYMKMIDIWLFACLTIPFVVFVVLVMADIITKRQNMVININKSRMELNGQKFLTICKVAIPLITFLSVAVYWLIALSL